MGTTVRGHDSLFDTTFSGEESCPLKPSPLTCLRALFPLSWCSSSECYPFAFNPYEWTYFDVRPISYGMLCRTHCRYAFDADKEASLIESAIDAVLAEGLRTGDLNVRYGATKLRTNNDSSRLPSTCQEPADE